MSREELVVLARAVVAENAVLKAENRELRERLARLERLVSRNSGNSGMPPTGDDQPGRVPPKDKKRVGVVRVAGRVSSLVRVG